jgi:hypothetical protein
MSETRGFPDVHNHVCHVSNYLLVTTSPFVFYLLYVRKKGKAVPLHATEALWGEEV